MNYFSYQEMVKLNQLGILLKSKVYYSQIRMNLYKAQKKKKKNFVSFSECFHPSSLHPNSAKGERDQEESTQNLPKGSVS